MKQMVMPSGTVLFSVLLCIVKKLYRKFILRNSFHVSPNTCKPLYTTGQWQSWENSSGAFPLPIIRTCHYVQKTLPAGYGQELAHGQCSVAFSRNYQICNDWGKDFLMVKEGWTWLILFNEVTFFLNQEKSVTNQQQYVMRIFLCI